MVLRKSKKVSYNPISEAKIRKIITEFIIMVMLLICTHIISETMHSRYIYYSNIQTQETFVRRLPYIREVHYDSWMFKDIRTKDHIFNYLMFNFVHLVHIDDRNDTASPHLLNIGLIVGAPRLRQIRIKPMKCLHGITIDDVDKRPCYGEYSSSVEFKGTYRGVDYKDDANAYWADFHRYAGGGFSVNMLLDPKENFIFLNSLYHSEWVDRATRLLVLEFSVFYDGNQMFQTIKLQFQIMPTGLVLPSTHIRCIPLRCFLFMDIGTMIVGIIFYAIVIYYTYVEIYEIVVYKLKIYFTTIQNYPDMIFLLASYSVLAFNVWQYFEIKKVYKEYNSNRVAYLNLDHLLLGWEVYSIIMGNLIFYVWMKLIRFMTFHRTLKRLAATIKQSRNNILGFLFIYIVVVMSFAQLGTIIFGEKVEQFKSNYIAVVTIMRIIMSDVSYKPLQKAQPILAPIYFVTLIVVIYGISLNLFVAIYLSTYSNVKKTMIVKDRLVLKLIAQGIKNYFRICGRRPPLKKQIKTFSIQPIIDEQHEKEDETVKSRPLKEKPIMRLREELAIFTERSLQIEIVLERLVVTIENIAELQKQKQKQNATAQS